MYHTETMKKINISIVAIVFVASTALASFVFVSDSKSLSNNVTLTTYKSASCGCCVKWIDHVEQNKLTVKAINTIDLNSLKDRYKVPDNYRSCHTAVSQDGYVFEGHIPAKYIQKFLQEKPKNQLGLVVPGMPIGSPGMEYQNKFSPYVIMAFDITGELTPYAVINQYSDQF